MGDLGSDVQIRRAGFDEGGFPAVVVFGGSACLGERVMYSFVDTRGLMALIIWEVEGVLQDALQIRAFASLQSRGEKLPWRQFYCQPVRVVSRRVDSHLHSHGTVSRGLLSKRNSPVLFNQNIREVF